MSTPRRSIGSRLHSAWRYSFIFFAWHLTKTVVFLTKHVRPLRFFGSTPREAAVRVWVVAWLAVVWVLLWGDPTWGTVLSGVGISVLVLVLMPLPRVPVEGRVHPLTVCWLVVSLLWDLLTASVTVAWFAIRPQRPPLSAVLRARMNIKSDLVLSLAINYINLVPATLVVEVDHARRLLYIHVLDASSEKAVRSFYKSVARVERLMVRAFERDADWQSSPYHGIDEIRASAGVQQ